MPAPVIIVDYDPHWPDLFEELRAPVVAALDSLVVIVEHVGSSAVPGLAAEPIIDMDVVVPSVTDIPEANARLAILGFVYRGDLGIPGRALAPASMATLNKEVGSCVKIVGLDVRRFSPKSLVRGCLAPGCSSGRLEEGIPSPPLGDKHAASARNRCQADQGLLRQTRYRTPGEGL